MMGHKHLHELLEEDQEPFLLNKYIADRRCQLNKPSVETHLQIKKRKPISQNSNLPSNFCKNACFFSRMSPLFESASPVKSPCRSPNAIFLHIPAKTAALLLEAALRIQKKSSPKTKHNGGTSFGFFGSILKRLTHRNRNRKRGIANDGANVPVKDTLGWDPTVVKNNSSRTKMSSSASIPEDKSGYEMGFSCSYNGRPSSAVWSESNEEKSLDTSCSCSQSEYFEEILTSSRDILVNNSAFSSCDSPFHFMLQKSPSLGHRTPLFSSPGISPQKQDEANYEVESLKKLQVEEDDEEKEQCSPVSVMDPRFEDDDDDRHVNDCDENDGFDLECSYAAMQLCRRAKQQLLHKLRRFEKLAGLDPIELEKIMLEQDQDDDNGYNGVCIVEEEESGNESVSSDDEMNVDGFLQVLNSSFHNPRHVPAGMKRLVTELITEEETEQSGYVDRVAVIKRVCKRLESWKEVESNTIDMMVEQNLRKEPDCWKRHQVQMRETALEVEHTIFGLLTKELSEELVSLTGA